MLQLQKLLETMTWHKFFIGDSRKVLKLLEDESIDLMVTSPAYFFSRTYADGEISMLDGNIGSSGNVNYGVYVEMLNECWEQVIRVLRANGKCAINLGMVWIGRNHPLSMDYGDRIMKNIMFDVEKYMYSQGMALFDRICWFKGSQSGHLVNDWKRNVKCLNNMEDIYIFVKPGKVKDKEEVSMQKMRPFKENMWHINPVIKINAKGENTALHPAPYPEELVRRLIEMYTIEGDTVLDIFLGSGTTSVAAKKLNRNSIGIDICKEYVENSAKRLDIAQTRIGGEQDTVEIIDMSKND